MAQPVAEHRDRGRAVVITGLGIISSLGCDVNEVTAALRAGRSGVVVDPTRQAVGFRSALTGEIRGFDPRSYGIKGRRSRRMCEPAQFAFAAATQAIRDAGLNDHQLQSQRAGLIFGNDSAVRGAVESIDTARASGNTHSIGGNHIFRAMNSTVNMNLATEFGMRGANWSVSAACASSAHALGQAMMLIDADMQDLVLVGGAQELHWYAMAAFDALEAFSTRCQDPTAASRPFDSDRDGLVPSGGAACLVLESENHARQRGAQIYGVLRGYGFSSDGPDCLFRSSADGIMSATLAALADAGVDPSDVDYINAHATSTPAGDRVEAQAIAQVYGTSTPVASTKALTGHECWMAGASEVLYTTLMARGQFVAPNLNFHEHDADGPPIDVVAETRAQPIRLAVSNSFGFGGTNAVCVLEFPR